MKQIAYWMAALMFLLAGPVAASAQTTASPVVENITVHAPSVEGNLEGNSADRQVFVILPPSYASSPRRHYPVVYFLHGYLSTAQGYMDHFALAEGTAKAFRNGAKEMIVVVPDSDTRHGGSYYASSPTVGDFGTFIARDLVGYIDQHYRTLAKPESRGLAGHSMGGYGTLRIAMKHPGIFSSAYAMSACCLGPRELVAAQLKPLETISLEQAEKGDFQTRSLLSTAAAFSPAPGKPPFYLETGLRADGSIDPLVSEKWAANAPLVMIPQYIPALKSLTALAMDGGDQDSLTPTVLSVRAELERFGIKVDWTEYSGDHVNRVAERFSANVIPFFSAHLKGE